MDWINVLGMVGAAIILGAFLMNQLGKWRNDAFIYDFSNLVGGVMMVVYAIFFEAWPFAVLNFVWAAVSLRDLVKGRK